MEFATHSSVLLAALTVSSLALAAGCSSAAQSAGSAAPAPALASASATKSAAQPTVPRQFIADADAGWTLEKPLVGRERKCENGKVATFPCKDIDLLSFLPANAIGGSDLNDIWGWADPASGRTFALVGRNAGTSFVEITDPLNPRYLGELPFHEGTRPTPWRDIKVYQHYAYVVAGGGLPHGVQVFDLKQLLDVKNAPVTFPETAHYDRVASVHNLAVDTAAGFLYAVGNMAGEETCGSGMHMIDIHDPLKPAFAGCYIEKYSDRGYIHDSQCVIYHGPDKTSQGREICLNSSEQALSIVDVTDKKDPKVLGVGRYPNVAYTHQGWLTEDQRYFFLGDEIDEEQFGNNTRTLVFDLNTLSDPVLVKEFFGPSKAIDHNMYVRGHYLYQSNYASGLRVLDIADPKNPQEVAYFDTHPQDDATQYTGTWSNYPYYPSSGLIAVSSIGEGLFVLRFRKAGR